MTRWGLVVEDEQPLGSMVCDNLANEGYGTELLDNGEAALARLEQGGIDLVVLDVMLPGRDGFEVLRAMRQRDDRTPVLILSARSSDRDRIRGLELEADDYLTKPFQLRELLLRVAALLRRAVPTAAGEDVLEIGGNRIDFRTQELRRFDGRREELSATETRMLRMLAAQPGTVISRTEIVQALFGPATPRSTRTVDNLVLRLRKLLERDPRRPQLLTTVRGLGWRLRDGSG